MWPGAAIDRLLLKCFPRRARCECCSSMTMTCPYAPAKVRIVLAEKKLPWHGVHLNLRAGYMQKPEYLALNPGAVVPTLVHRGSVIIESTVICEIPGRCVSDAAAGRRPDRASPHAPVDEAARRGPAHRRGQPQHVHRLPLPASEEDGGDYHGLLRRHPERRDARAAPAIGRARHGVADVRAIFEEVGSVHGGCRAHAPRASMARGRIVFARRHRLHPVHDPPRASRPGGAVAELARSPAVARAPIRAVEPSRGGSEEAGIRRLQTFYAHRAGVRAKAAESR